MTEDEPRPPPTATSPPQASDPKSIERIRQLNDNFRRGLQGGTVVVSIGVHALGPRRVAWLLRKVAAYEQFTPDNDPHQEHDFGAFGDLSDRFFWKIDYYDLNLDLHSPDPADPERTRRVLTLMLDSEY